MGSSLLVLLVEGNGTEAGRSLQSHLESQGCMVIAVSDSTLALKVAQQQWPDLIVLNGFSGLSGVVDMCTALDRSPLEVPRLLVCEKESENPVRAHACLGAPITARRLANRIKKALGTQAERFVRAGDVSLDTVQRNVKCRGRVAHLTPKELGLLGYLMKHAGREVSRLDIMRDVWDTEYTGDTRTVEVHIRWLRRKIEEDPKRPRHIITVRRVGYLFHPLEGDEAVL